MISAQQYIRYFVIKLKSYNEYIRVNPEECRVVLNIFHVKDYTFNPTALELRILVNFVLYFVLSENRTHSVSTLHHRCEVTYMCVCSICFYDFPIRCSELIRHYGMFLFFFVITSSFSIFSADEINFIDHLSGDNARLQN